MLTLALSRALWDAPSPDVFEPLCWLTGATTVGSGLSYLVGDGEKKQKQKQKPRRAGCAWVCGMGACMCTRWEGWRRPLYVSRLPFIHSFIPPGTKVLSLRKHKKKDKGSDDEPPAP